MYCSVVLSSAVIELIHRDPWGRTQLQMVPTSNHSISIQTFIHFHPFFSFNHFYASKLIHQEMVPTINHSISILQRVELALLKILTKVERVNFFLNLLESLGKDTAAEVFQPLNINPKFPNPSIQYQYAH